MRSTIFLLLIISALPTAALAQDHHHAARGSDEIAGIFLLAALIFAAIGLGQSVKTLTRVAGVMLASALVLYFLPANSFAAHMAQQLFLMDIAAPLCVLAWLAGPERLPVGLRKLRLTTTPFGAGMIHAAVMWGWHVPAFYNAINASAGLHSLMPLTFFGSGLLFWTGIVRARGSRPSVALFWLFMTVMHSGLLGALLTFTPTPLYGAEVTDQQLGGAVMWVMGTLIYAAAGLAVAARWLNVLDRADAHERAA